MKNNSFAVFFLLTVVFQVYAEAGDLKLSSKAKKIVGAYKSEVLKIQLEYMKNFEKTHNKTICALNREMKYATKQGDWEEANSITSKIEELENLFVLEKQVNSNLNNGKTLSHKIAKMRFDQVPERFLISKRLQVKMHSESSSEFDSRYPPRNAIDGTLDFDFALKGPKGWLKIAITEKAVARYLVIYNRPSQDHYVKGRLFINKYHPITIDGFNGGQVLIVEFQRPLLIKSVKLESLKGVNNPGVSEIFLVR